MIILISGEQPTKLHIQRRQWGCIGFLDSGRGIIYFYVQGSICQVAVQSNS